MQEEILKRLDKIIELLQLSQSPWLSTEQACEYVHISKSTLEKLIKLELIRPYYLLKGKRLFKVKELDEIIESFREKSQPGRKRTINLRRILKDVSIEL